MPSPHREVEPLAVRYRRRVGGRRPGLASAAGAVGALLGPPLLVVAVLAGRAVTGNEAGLVLAVSTISWGTLHLAGPLRGHPILLAGALVGLWLTPLVRPLVDLADGSGGGPAGGVVAGASFALGAVYGLVGRGAHRQGLRAAGAVLVGAGVLCLSTGALVASWTLLA
jgi:hypothetical protein